MKEHSRRLVRFPSELAERKLRLRAGGTLDSLQLLRWLARVGDAEEVRFATECIAADFGATDLPPAGIERAEVICLRLLWLAWADGPAAFYEIASTVFERADFHVRCAFASTNFVPWNTDVEIKDAKTAVRIRRHGEFVMQWKGGVKGGKPGRLRTKTHASAEKATKDVAKRTSAAEKKLSAGVAEPTVNLHDPFFGDKAYMDYREPQSWPSWWSGQ